MKPLLINLDLKTNNYAELELKQGCDDTVIATITDLGEVVDLAGQVVTVEMLKADKTFIIQSNNIGVLGNKITIKLNKDFTRVFGKAKLQIKLTKATEIMGSWVVDCWIREGAINQAIGESGNVVTIIETLENNINLAVEENAKTENLILNGGAATKGELAETNSQLAESVNDLRIGKSLKNKEIPEISNLYNKNDNVGIFNLMNEFDINSAWYTASGVTLSDKITIDGIELTKTTSNNFYNSLETRTGIGINLVAGKKYLCSAYCFTFGKPKYFYSMANGTKSNYAHYCDNTLRRYWFIIDGAKNITWYTKGYSGLNEEAVNEIFLGGFQVEEILNTTKNGLIVIGDSTVEGSSGGDAMNQNEWVKRVSSLLNVKHWNKGKGGDRTQQMIDRWATDITPFASECKYIIIQGGINDLGKVGSTFDTIKTNMQTMHDKAITDGLIPIHCTITPCNKIGDDETLRNLVNEWIKVTFDKVLDLSSVVEDIVDKSKLLQVNGWVGDGVHYAQGAKDSIANYIVSQSFWDLVYPSKYQKLEKGIEIGGTKFLTGTQFRDINGNSKFEIMDFATGLKLNMKDGLNLATIQYIYNTLTFINNSKETLRIGDDGTIKAVVKLELPWVQPTVIGDNAIWYDNVAKKYKCSASGVIKTIAFEP